MCEWEERRGRCGGGRGGAGRCLEESLHCLFYRSHGLGALCGVFAEQITVGERGEREKVEEESKRGRKRREEKERRREERRRRREEKDRDEGREKEWGKRERESHHYIRPSCFLLLLCLLSSLPLSFSLFSHLPLWAFPEHLPFVYDFYHNRIIIQAHRRYLGVREYALYRFGCST